MLNRTTPMRRGQPLKRSNWLRSRITKVKQAGVAQRLAESLGLAANHKPKPPSVFRSVQHSRHVAALDCACCGKPGRSQAAHLNLLALGKGKGIKASDALQVPLCADGLMVRGCHSLLDQGGIYDKVQSASLQIKWLHDTRDALRARNQWPEAAEADMARLVGAYLARRA